MKRLLVLNPNRTAAMTARVVAQVAAVLAVLRAAQPVPGFEVQVEGLTCDDGPPVIDSVPSFEAGRIAALAAWRASHDGAGPRADALLLACFGDPGLEALRAEAGVPVAGMADSAMAAAAAQGLRFAILTAGPAWVPMLERRAVELGHAAGLAEVIALPVDGRALAEQPLRWQPALQAAAQQAAGNGAQALILGGAGFAGLRPLLASPLPVFDGIDEAARAAFSALQSPAR